jgi:hypothetical protein
MAAASELNAAQEALKDVIPSAEDQERNLEVQLNDLRPAPGEISRRLNEITSAQRATEAFLY